LHAVVHGDVQGVGFRWFIMRTARQLELHGWVRNRPDGSVELTAEGSRTDLESLLQAAGQGPSHAHVTNLETDWSPATGGLDAFDLTY
jgi:acylphosphatase